MMFTNRSSSTAEGHEIDLVFTAIAHLGLALAGIGTIGKLIIEGAP